jgi:hypothetical protein
MATDYVGVFPGATATVCTPVAVASTGDRIDGSDIINGAVLVVTCGSTATNITFTDPGKTPAGTGAGTVAAVPVAANTSKAFGKTQLQGYIDSTSNKVTVAYSAITNVTAMVVG